MKNIDIRLLFVCAFVFLFIFPLSNSISFMQNDDWVHYQQVENFIRGSWVLDPYMGPTFYTQGLIGAGFAVIFGLSRLPVLTLLFSIFNLFLIFKILSDQYKKSATETIILGFLFYFIPLNLYSVLGFMTETYLLFFFLVTYFMFLKYDKNRSSKNFALLYVYVSATFFLKQIALVFPLTFIIHYLLNKNGKEVIKHMFSFLLILAYFFLLFPQTEAMRNKSFAFNHIFDIYYIYSLLAGILIIITAFYLTLILVNIKIPEIFNKKVVIPYIFAGLLVTASYFILFKPGTISWEEFPYFENTFERMGFYPRGIHGTKYHFIGSYDLYKYWSLLSNAVLLIFLPYFFTTIKRYLDINLSLIIVYTGTMLVTDTFYDRYILIILPFVLFLLAKNISFNNLQKIFISLFTFCMAFYSLQMSFDFVAINNYVWNKAESLSTKNNEIYASHAWNSKYKSSLKNHVYLFSYDSPKVNPEFECCYSLIEKKTLDYPLNMFIEPKIYLYKKVSDFNSENLQHIF